MAPTEESEDLPFRVAIVGGGITGACAASTLLSSYTGVCVDLFDQGRRGPGGRASHRRVTHANNSENGEEELRFDHGAQFFRADTQQFRERVLEWIEGGFVKEWEGRFMSDVKDGQDPDAADTRGFFGMPSRPPFYVGADGMNSVIEGVLGSCCSASGDERLRVHKGTRVADMRRTEDGKWALYGTSGEIAYHDTSEAKVQAAKCQGDQLGRSTYHVVILTDVSSSFGTWHRASAGVPEEFAAKVRERVGARVPLMTAMVAFESRLDVPFDAAGFTNNKVIWFAARSSSKPGLASSNEGADCWTLVSTPEYALEKIEETPMQDPATGAFIPQSPSYLTTVPGPDLEGAFREAISNRAGLLGDDSLDAAKVPKTIHLDAQRWGSAMPCHRHLDGKSATRRIVSGVPYDGARAPLAPTKVETRVGRGSKDDGANFLADDGLGLIQAGDMMSIYTPGFEGAALSGMDAAEHALRLLLSQGNK